MEAAGINRGDVAVRDLTPEDWTIIADVFEAWPFRPQVRHNSRTLRAPARPLAHSDFVHARRCSTRASSRRPRRDPRAM